MKRTGKIAPSEPISPLISIVTGTYNRLNSLQMMVFSARADIFRGVTLEFVIVDGGSTDGTLEWLRQQPDVVLIEEGALTGALKAFCRGARAANGTYVVMANDDITFHRLSLLRAVSHLERTLTCAAVAFADNRTSLLTGDKRGNAYRVEGIGCTLPDGALAMVPYAQVGMFRKGLGTEAGWWGDQDPIMSKSRMYGGDSYLSARLWEMGYTVDPVEGCVIEDGILRDELREHNNSLTANDGATYYERFPTVHIPAEKKQYQSLDLPKMRIIHMPVYEPQHPAENNPEAGLTEAFGEYGHCLEVDYLNTKFDVVEIVRMWQPDLILLQAQGWGEKMTPDMISRMRLAAPNVVIVNWNGDAHEEGLVGSAVVDLLLHVDLQTTVNAAVLPRYRELGIPAAYWQIGFKKAVRTVTSAAHDVVCQMNCYNERRSILAAALKRLPHDVGIYGNCGNVQPDGSRIAINGNTHYDFALQEALNRAAKIVVGDTYPRTLAFVSNRFVQVLSVGGFLLQEYSPELEAHTGFIDGIHYVSWIDIDDLLLQIEYYLNAPKERARIADAGQRYCIEHFSFPAQVRKLLFHLLPDALYARTDAL